MIPKSSAALLLIEIIFFCCCVKAQRKGDVAVAVNSDNPIQGLSLAELRKIFAGEKHTWPGGAPIKLVVRAPGSHERIVLMHLLRMSEADYKQYWLAQMLRGEASIEPIVVPSVGMQRESLIAFPGAITLVDADNLKPGMKVLKVDGHLPGDSQYPLF